MLSLHCYIWGRHFINKSDVANFFLLFGVFKNKLRILIQNNWNSMAVFRCLKCIFYGNYNEAFETLHKHKNPSSLSEVGFFGRARE